MAEKQYISPVRLLDHLGINCNEALQVSRIKKLLSAEFSLAKDGFIQVEGFSYNRTDVMEEVEREDFIQRMHWHLRVWQSPGLLLLLENNNAAAEDVRKALDDFQHQPEFDAFFSPFFAAPFNTACRQSITNCDLATTGDWLTLEAFLLPAERETAFRSIRVFLDETEHLFHNISKENYTSFRNKLAPWLNAGWSHFLNNLPDELWDYREALAVSLINLTVKIQHSYKDDCKTISRDLVKVEKLSQSTRETILNNDRVYNKTGSSSGFNYWWLIWAVLMLLRLANGC
ncbi:MAG: hypothetical protein U0V75_03105 [Ferruginibacter sp.]